MLGLIGWFALAGCNPDATTVTPSSADLGQLNSAILVDTFALQGSTRSFDSTLSSETNIVLVGNYSHPLAGSITATGYFDFAQPTRLDTLPAQSRFDSIIITLPYTWQHAPSLPLNSLVELHRLQDPISKDSIFLARHTRAYAGAVLATDTVIATQTSVRGGKSLKYKLTSQQTSLGEELLQFGKKGFENTVAKNAAFARRFLGFALVPASNPNGSSQSVVANVGVGSGTMLLHFTQFRQGKPDTSLSRAFNLGSVNRFYGSVATDYANTPLAQFSKANPTLPATQTSGNMYVQNYSALWAKLDFPTYSPFLKRNPDLTLLRAVLELKASSPPALLYQGPLPRILPWQGSADHLSMARNGNYNRALANGTPTDATVAAAYEQRYDSAAKAYSIDITSYLLAIEQGTVYNAGLWITAPVGIPFLAPFIFNISQADPNRSKLKAYFVRLNK